MTICCPNCGIQVSPAPDSIGEMPLEEQVLQSDEVRKTQLRLSRQGADYRHSVSIAAGFNPEIGGRL